MLLYNQYLHNLKLEKTKHHISLENNTMKTNNKQEKNNWSKVILVSIGITILFILACIVLCNTISDDIMSTYDIISLSLSTYSSLSLVLLVIQLIVAKQESRDRHDEKRREKTVDYIIKWSESLSWETTHATHIVETFNHKQCECLYKKLPFEVNYETKKNLCPICSSYSKNTCRKCINNGVNCSSNETIEANNKEQLYTIDAIQCTELRWYVIKYLNHLEALLISWKQGIVDRDIIEEQFCYLYDPASGTDTLQSFRNIAGDGKSYPTIEEFCLELRNKRQQSTNKMKRLL